MDLSLPTGTVVEKEEDVLGGNGAIDSGIYKGRVELAYIDESSGGAKNINIHFVGKNGQVIKNTTYISNKKGGFTYVDKKTNKTMPLPGYSQMDAFFIATTGKGIDKQPTSLKTIKVYNFDAKKEMPKEVSVFEDVTDVEIAIAIMKISEEKTTKESGYKNGTGEFREHNEFVKYFDPVNGLTTSEKLEGLASPVFFGKWKEKNTGKVRVKKAKNPGTPSSATKAGAPAGASADDIDPFAD